MEIRELSLKRTGGAGSVAQALKSDSAGKMRLFFSFLSVGLIGLSPSVAGSQTLSTGPVVAVSTGTTVKLSTATVYHFPPAYDTSPSRARVYISKVIRAIAEIFHPLDGAITITP